MNDKFQILKNMAKECNREDISLKDYAVKLADDYSKVCKSNFKLQQENRQLKDRIDKALKLIKENVKDEYGIIDVAVVWEIESVLEGGKVVKD